MRDPLFNLMTIINSDQFTQTHTFCVFACGFDHFSHSFRLMHVETGSNYTTKALILSSNFHHLLLTQKPIFFILFTLQVNVDLFSFSSNDFCTMKTTIWERRRKRQRDPAKKNLNLTAVGGIIIVEVKNGPLANESEITHQKVTLMNTCSISTAFTK